MEYGKDKIRILIDNLPDAFAYHRIVEDGIGNSVNYIILDVNPVFERITGYSGEELIGKKVTELRPMIEVYEIDWLTLYSEVVNSGESKSFEQYFENTDHCYAITVYSDKSGFFGILFRDISSKNQEKEAMSIMLKSTQNNLQQPFGELNYRSMTDDLLKLSGAKFVGLNTYEEEGLKIVTRALSGIPKSICRASEIMGFDLIGKQWDVIPERLKSIREGRLLCFENLYYASSGAISRQAAFLLEKLFGLGEVYIIEIAYQESSLGDYIIFMSKDTTIKNPEFIEIYADQSGIMLLRKQAEEKIRYISYHDNLTGLYNRCFMEEEMKRLDTGRQLPISIIMADLNVFKLVNDTYGHAKGDEMLKSAAGILRDECRKEDIIARWGGDEFMIMLPQTTVKEAEKICKRIDGRCKEEKVEDMCLSISLGYACKETVDIELTEVMTEAEKYMYKKKIDESRRTKSFVIKHLLEKVGEKSYETERHIRQMTKVARKIAEKIALSDVEVKRLELLVNMHDIGKINISKDILTKKGSLTEEEWEKIQEHPITGYQIARATEEYFQVAEDILAHHEHWNGSGYPKGLKGGKIPLLARIVAIADAYEVMGSGRPYKKSMSDEEIVTELKRCAGTQFDPELIDTFLLVLQEDKL